MKPAYLIWDDLLQTIAAKRPSFCSTLTQSLLNGITNDSVDTRDEMRKNAMTQWIIHLITRTSWQKSLRCSEELRNTILERCVTHPDSWSKRLARAVLDESDNDFQEQWEPYFQTSFLDIESEDDETPPPRYGQTDGPAKSFDHKLNIPNLDYSIEARKHRKFASNSQSDAPDLTVKSGWRLWEGGWLAKPIGFPHPRQEESR